MKEELKYKLIWNSIIKDIRSNLKVSRYDLNSDFDVFYNTAYSYPTEECVIFTIYCISKNRYLKFEASTQHLTQYVSVKFNQDIHDRCGFNPYFSLYKYNSIMLSNIMFSEFGFYKYYKNKQDDN